MASHHSPEPDSLTLYEKHNELKRVLESKYFAKAPKRRRFLEFTCGQVFLGEDSKLNEYLIGVEVYERGQDFDPQKDPIVRVQAHEIRRALKNYYQDEGKNSLVRVELNPGNYAPIFKRVKLDSEPRQPRCARETPGSGGSREDIPLAVRHHGLPRLGVYHPRCFVRPGARSPTSTGGFGGACGPSDGKRGMVLEAVSRAERPAACGHSHPSPASPRYGRRPSGDATRWVCYSQEQAAGV